MNSLQPINAWQKSTQGQAVRVGLAGLRVGVGLVGEEVGGEPRPRRRSARGRRRSGRRRRIAAVVSAGSRAASPSAQRAAERAVQEHQGLRGGRRRPALADADEVLGPVEEHHRRDELAPLDREIDAPPPHRLGRACRGRTSSGRAGRRPRASRRGSARPRAGGGRAARGRRSRGRSPRGPRRTGRPACRRRSSTISLWSGLSRQPSRTSSSASQSSNSGWVGRLALGAEVVGRGDDPPAEVVLPEPVDDHPRGQVPGAVVGVGQPVRQRRRGGSSCGSSPRGARPASTSSVVAVAHQDAEEAGRRPRPSSG